MKPILYLSFLLLILTGCSKDRGYKDSGTIIGPDYRKCMCCGGWFIKIDQDTLRFDRLPRWCAVELTDVMYPVEVYLDWQQKDPKCLGDEIVVTRIELKK